ncbi:unnamed protein product [Dibothriocephalus latus]|uniref:Calponin-homology (CH) domain-containing protein n=1 Tax=Dibothriocephalus latus TaxID=60516 RepID=A0A3P7LWT7_DIBLA|nr:unnamed protein product [Dibothriocephalus latus]
MSPPTSTPKTQTMGKQDEFSTAIAEDLAEWASHLFPDLAGDLKGDNFFDQISDGILLCQYATQLHQRMTESRSGSKESSKRRLQGVRVASARAFLPIEPPKYHSREFGPRSRAGAPFWVRENIASFLKWCRSVGFPDSILFETEDLVSRKNLRSVTVCLLEVARLSGKFGVEVPEIVHLEKQIDAELAAERRGVSKREGVVKPSTPKNNSPVADVSSLDEVVSYAYT